MRQRSANEKFQSGPVAPTWVRSSHQVVRPSPMLKPKKSSAGSMSWPQRKRPRFHQQTNSTTAGKEKAVAFDRYAARNNTSAETYAVQSGCAELALSSSKLLSLFQNLAYLPQLSNAPR